MNLALAVLLTSTGCLSSLPDPAAPPDAAASDDGPAPDAVPTTPPVAVTADGAYQVASGFDVTLEALLPAPAASFVATLRAFETAPAHTLITLAGEAGVPAVGTLRAVLPDALESRLEGWIDAELAQVQIAGLPLTAVAGHLAALAETALTRFALASELTIADGTATHRLTTLDLAPAGLDVQLALGALPADVVVATSTATTRDGALALGAHGFAFAYGAYAWQAVDAAFAAEFGADIRATFGAAVNCPRIAARVAAKCVLGVCVGHATELTQVCERGLDEVVARTRAKFEAYRFDAVHLAAGTATLRDVDADARADQLTGGVWTAEINAGQGLRPVPASFTATR